MHACCMDGTSSRKAWRANCAWWLIFAFRSWNLNDCWSFEEEGIFILPRLGSFRYYTYQQMLSRLWWYRKIKVVIFAVNIFSRQYPLLGFPLREYNAPRHAIPLSYCIIVAPSLAPPVNIYCSSSLSLMLDVVTGMLINPHSRDQVFMAIMYDNLITLIGDGGGIWSQRIWASTIEFVNIKGYWRYSLINMSRTCVIHIE